VTELTIAALQQRQPDVTLYVIESDRRYYAFLGDKDLDEDRLHDLLLEGEQPWRRYFDSSWFPMASGATASEANDALVTKIRSVPVEDIDKFNRVMFTHVYYIFDNYSAELASSLEDAHTDCVKWAKQVQAS
jgi:hypothetical protein